MSPGREARSPTGRWRAPSRWGRARRAARALPRRRRTLGPVIQIDGVNKIYRTGEIHVQALRDISLRISRGDFVAVMGSSGSGKSTLMSIVGCLDAPSSGRYLLDGMDVRGLDDQDLADVRGRKIGVVFQSYNLLPRISAAANVELPLAYAGLPRSERRRRSLRALRSVGMADRVHHSPAALSGGEQQRVAVARAIVTNPSLILADEPTGNLDSHATEEVLRIFSSLNAEGRTVMLITHEHPVADVAKRVIHLEDGALVEDRRTAPIAGLSPGMRDLLELPREGQPDGAVGRPARA